MKTELLALDSYPPNSNPLMIDLYHMGQTVGKDLAMLHANHPSEPCNYLIFVNTKTGKRVKVKFGKDFNN